MKARPLSSAALELASSESRYRLLFERSLAGVYRTTIDGRILDVNEACFRIFGYASREEHLAHNAADVWFEHGFRDLRSEQIVFRRLEVTESFCEHRECARDWHVDDDLTADDRGIGLVHGFSSFCCSTTS